MEVSEQPKTIWSNYDFVGNMINGARTHPVTMKRLPEKIDLTGEVGDISDQLKANTLSDPRKRERSISAKVNLHGGIEYEDEVLGSESSVTSRTSYTLEVNQFMPPHYYGHFTGKTSEYPAFSMHTHGIADEPPSPKIYMICLLSLKKELTRRSW